MTLPTPSDAKSLLAAWEQWRERCAAGRCDGDVRRVLTDFAGRRAARWWERLGARDRAAPPPPADAWHRFETHLVTGRTRRRLAYKEWLFARAEGLAGTDRLDAICGGATLILRDVIRDWLRRETAAPMVVSMDAPVAGTDGLTLSDLLSGGEDPGTAAAERDLESAARRMAAGVFEAAGHPARVGLCLRALGLPLFGPAAERMAGCGKTKLNAAVRKFAEALAVRALRDYGGDGRAVAEEIALKAMAFARDLAVRWGRAEKTMAPAFMIQVEPPDPRCGAARSAVREEAP